MKPYGIPRVKDVIRPDVQTGRDFAVKPSLLNFPGKGGDIRSTFKSAEKKQATRRIWAKKARAEQARETRAELGVY